VSRIRFNSMVLLELATLVVMFFQSAVVEAQISTGGIEGVVTDANRAVVTGAQVTITEKRTGRTLTATTSGGGIYSWSALQPGSYEVRVEAGGFKTAVREVVVQVGQVATADVGLQVGAPSEVVNVQSDGAVAVNTTTNTVEGVVTERQIDNLPLNGRNFLDLAQLQPGVQIVDGGSFDPTKNQFTGISVGGRSGRVTRIQIDGIDISDETVGTTTQNISQDALQEFQLSQSSLDPSTSLTSSGAVNIITKSGGKEFHGSGFIFYRDEEVAAVPVTFTGDPAVDRDLRSAEFDREQGGFRFGGPLLKNRLFGFINYEKSNQDSTTFTRPTNFPNFARAVTTPFNENLGLARLDLNVSDNVRAFFRFSHNSNDAATGFGGSAFCCAPFVNDNNTNVIAAGVDVTHGPFTHSFRYGHTSFDNHIVPATLGLPVFEAANGTPVSVSLGAGRSVFFSGPNRLAPQSTFQTNDQFKYDGSFTRGRHSLRYGAEFNNIRVNLFASFFGVGPEVRGTFNTANRNAIIARGGNPLDPLEYPASFIVFGNGQGSFTEIANNGRSAGGINNLRFSYYVQDSWRARSNLTLNFGVKYEVDPGQVNDDLAGPAFLEQVVGPGQSRPTRADKNNFGPIVGLAYDFSGAGKTVLRAGAGFYYETQIFNNAIFDRTNRLPVGFGFATANPPFDSLDAQGRLLAPNGQPVSNINLNTILGQPIRQGLNQVGQLQQLFQQASAAIPVNPNAPALLEASGTTAAGPIFNRDFASPVAFQLNVGVQRELEPGLILSVDYVRNRTTHANIVRDYNRVFAANTLDRAAAIAFRDAALVDAGFAPGVAGVNQAIAAGQDFSLFGGLSGAFPGNFPQFGQVQVITTSGISEYNALQVRLTGRFNRLNRLARNLLLDVSYALSRFNGVGGGIGSSGAGDQDFINPTQFNDDFLNPRNFGPTSLDRTHQITANTLLGLPFGINLNTIINFRTALPTTPFLTETAGGGDEIFFSDLDGDGIGGDILPGAGRGAFGRTIGSVGELNGLISSFNGQVAGTLTPASQSLVTAGVFTADQLRALGFVAQRVPLAPAGQVENDSFITTDVRVSKTFSIGERVRIEPLADIFNLFNVANFALLSGELGGSAGQINGTTRGQRTDRLGLGSGSFSQGLARSVQFGLRVSF